MGCFESSGNNTSIHSWLQYIHPGKAADAAYGIKTLLGISDVQVATFLIEQVEAIKREFATHGSVEDKENLRCVLDGELRPGWASPIIIAELMAHEAVLKAKIEKHHIIALR